MMKQTVLPIKLKKSDELITAHSGLIIVAEAIKSYGLEEAFKQLPKPGSNRGKKALDYLIPILLSFGGGGRELEDVERLFSDQLL